MFDFRTLRTNISWLNFLVKCKNPIFERVLVRFAQNRQNQNFPKKSGSVTLLHAKNQKNPMIQFREKAGRTEGQTHDTEFIRPHYRGSKM